MRRRTGASAAALWAPPKERSRLGAASFHDAERPQWVVSGPRTTRYLRLADERRNHGLATGALLHPPAKCQNRAGRVGSQPSAPILLLHLSVGRLDQGRCPSPPRGRLLQAVQAWADSLAAGTPTNVGGGLRLLQAYPFRSCHILRRSSFPRKRPLPGSPMGRRQTLASTPALQASLGRGSSRVQRRVWADPRRRPLPASPTALPRLGEEALRIYGAV